MMTKLYAALGLLVVLGLAWMRYDHVVEDRDAQKRRADSALATVETQAKTITIERKNAADADLRAQDRQREKKVLQDEYDEKVKCIAAGNCGVVVRWKNAICAQSTSISSTGSTSGGFDAGTVSDQKDFARWLATLEASIDSNTSQIIGLQKEIRIRSDPEYCRIK